VRLRAFESSASQNDRPGAEADAISMEQYRAYLLPERKRPEWLRWIGCLAGTGVPQDSPSGRKYFAAVMEARRQGEQAQEYKAVRRGWCLGDKAFRKELLGQMQERRGAEHYGEERFESDEAKALAIVEQEFKRRRWKEEDLKGRRKGDKDKVAIAARLRRETTMTLKWIAGRLAMGSWNNVSNRLAALRRGKQR